MMITCHFWSLHQKVFSLSFPVHVLKSEPAAPVYTEVSSAPLPALQI